MFTFASYDAYRMCLRYCVLGFAAHSIISGTGNASNDDCLDDEDRYDYMGYGSDYEGCDDDFYE